MSQEVKRITWHTDWDEAVAVAQRKQRPVLIDFWDPG